MNRIGALPLRDVASLVNDMALGLHLAHELKIVHRDLKPENIMVCRRPDGADYAVVMDFGLAKERKAGAELQKLTATGIILGTPEFMSPEQLRGKPLDARTDIYSLALMVYEMLTGKLPFQGRTQQEMMIALASQSIRPLAKGPAGAQSAGVNRKRCWPRRWSEIPLTTGIKRPSSLPTRSTAASGASSRRPKAAVFSESCSGVESSRTRWTRLAKIDRRCGSSRPTQAHSRSGRTGRRSMRSTTRSASIFPIPARRFTASSCSPWREPRRRKR